jgi:hypothetical protein
MICDGELLKARWEFALAEDDFSSVKNMINGTGEICEITNREW